MHTEILTYEADGLSMESHLYLNREQSGKRPGVLVFPEAFGLGEHAKSRAERLAGLGYVALACDLHGGGSTVTSMEEVMPLMTPLMSDSSHARVRSAAGLHALLARPEVDSTKIAAIGFCFGGTMSLELARSGADVAGVVSFHGGLGTTLPDGAKNIKAKVLVCTGADDPMIGPDVRGPFEAEMRAGSVDWQMHLYGGVVHSFTNPEADKLGQSAALRYDAKADTRSWATMLSFFDEIFA